MISARVLAFGVLDPALWGAAWVPDGPDTLTLVLGTTTATGVLSGELGMPTSESEWSLEGDDVSLRIAGAGPRAPDRSAPGRLRSADSLCTVTGHVVLDGVRHEVSCPGWRATVQADLELGELDSFRQVAGWIGSEDGVALLSLRPGKARGHEGDVVLATVLQSDPARAVVDPRLSTTYTAAGTPSRTTLELWFEETDSDEEEGTAPPYPRRASGEAVGAGIDWDVSGFALHAELLSWHTRGADGTGVYLLGRRP